MSKPETPCWCEEHKPGCAPKAEAEAPPEVLRFCSHGYVPACPECKRAEAPPAPKWCGVCGSALVRHRVYMRPDSWVCVKSGCLAWRWDGEHAPSAQKSVDKNHAFQVDRVFYPVERNEMTGWELIGLLDHPADRELWQSGVGAPDRKISPDDVVEVRAGCRFYSAPKYINNSNHSEQPLNMVQPAPPAPVSEPPRCKRVIYPDGPTCAEDIRALLDQINSLKLDRSEVIRDNTALKAQNAALDSDYQRIIREIIPHAKPASGRADDQLEPPWEVVSRIVAQNATLTAEVKSAHRQRALEVMEHVRQNREQAAELERLRAAADRVIKHRNKHYRDVRETVDALESVLARSLRAAREGKK